MLKVVNFAALNSMYHSLNFHFVVVVVASSHIVNLQGKNVRYLVDTDEKIPVDGYKTWRESVEVVDSFAVMISSYFLPST